MNRMEAHMIKRNESNRRPIRRNDNQRNNINWNEITCYNCGKQGHTSTIYDEYNDYEYENEIYEVNNEENDMYEVPNYRNAPRRSDRNIRNKDQTINKERTRRVDNNWNRRVQNTRNYIDDEMEDKQMTPIKKKRQLTEEQ
ncbi:unnamed protein product [Rhizophagus irregularis]|nr:unnamed protein product [Rhizophagus irregularis]